MVGWSGQCHDVGMDSLASPKRYSMTVSARVSLERHVFEAFISGCATSRQRKDRGQRLVPMRRMDSQRFKPMQDLIRVTCHISPMLKSNNLTRCDLYYIQTLPKRCPH